MNKCRCISEPRGRGGLNGFIEGNEYQYENEVVKNPLSRKLLSFYKIYLYKDHFDTCGVTTFSKYFEVVEIRR